MAKFGRTRKLRSIDELDRGYEYAKMCLVCDGSKGLNKQERRYKLNDANWAKVQNTVSMLLDQPGVRGLTKEKVQVHLYDLEKRGVAFLMEDDPNPEPEPEPVSESKPVVEKRPKASMYRTREGKDFSRITTYIPALLKGRMLSLAVARDVSQKQWIAEAIKEKAEHDET